jgi:hypothetical protein
VVEKSPVEKTSAAKKSCNDAIENSSSYKSENKNLRYTRRSLKEKLITKKSSNNPIEMTNSLNDKSILLSLFTLRNNEFNNQIKKIRINTNRKRQIQRNI